jgi:hypothetical protein
VEQGENFSRVLLHSYKIFNFDINLGKPVFGKMLMLIWGGGGGVYFRVEHIQIRFIPYL